MGALIVRLMMPERVQMTPEQIAQMIRSRPARRPCRGVGRRRRALRGHVVVHEAFQGKLPLARHRMVYARLGDKMGGEIHALALKTLTPAEAQQA